MNEEDEGRLSALLASALLASIRDMQQADSERLDALQMLDEAEALTDCCGAPFISDTDFCGHCHEHAGKAPPLCPECGEERADDDRVRAGMKCRFCAYSVP